MKIFSNPYTTRISPCIALVVLFAWIAPASAQDKKPSAGDVMSGVQEFYKNTSDYQARFEQVYTDTAAGDTRTSGGKVFFKKPGKMRWDYLETKEGKTAIQKVIISDSKRLTIYEPRYNQYFRQCMNNSQLPSALSFLMGQGDLARDFKPTLKKPKNGLTSLELKPKKSSGQYKKLVFHVDPSTYEVKHVTIYDPYGNTNRISFQKTRINKNLPDSGFAFAVPKGARVVAGKKGDVTCK